MLRPVQVIPFLTHEDAWVREHALHYLAEADDPAPTTADDLWRAIGQLGPGHQPCLFGCLGTFRGTEQCTNRLLSALSEPSAMPVYFYQLQALCQLDFGLLERFIKRIERVPNLPGHVLEHMRQRLHLARETPDALWRRLMDHATAIELFEEEPDRRVADRIIEALARHPGMVAPRALNLLNVESIAYWTETFCIRFVGATRYRPATDALIDRLGAEDPCLGADAKEALNRLGGAGLVDKLAARFVEGDVSFRVSAAQPFGRIKLPESEQALLGLLYSERDMEVVEFLCDSICQLCPTDPHVLAPVRHVVMEGFYDPMVVELPDQLLAIGEMIGWWTPEMFDWRQDAREHVERFRSTFNACGIAENTMEHWVREGVSYTPDGQRARGLEPPDGSG